MSKTSVFLPKISEPVIVENCHPKRFYLIANNEMSVKVGSNIWSKIRDLYARTLKDNPTQEFICYELYLNKEKSHKLTAIERKNFGTEIKFHIADCCARKDYVLDYQKDIIAVESKEYHEQRAKYLEENREEINARYRQQYQEKKKNTQKVISTTPESVPETPKEESDVVNLNSFGVPVEMMALFSSLIDENKVAEKKRELENVMKNCGKLKKLLDLFS